MHIGIGIGNIAGQLRKNGEITFISSKGKWLRVFVTRLFQKLRPVDSIFIKARGGASFKSASNKAKGCERFRNTDSGFFAKSAAGSLSMSSMHKAIEEGT